MTTRDALIEELDDGLVCLLEQDTYQPGDPAPDGYLAWHEWAEVQHKAGLRQTPCGRCGLWRYPQELSRQTMRRTAQSRKGPVEMIAPVCSQCGASVLTHEKDGENS